MKRRNILQAIAAMVFVTGFIACQSQKQIVSEVPSAASQQPIPMILDSDFGSSTDDLFALMMLHHYIDEGKVDLKGIIVDREGEKNAAVVDVFNTYYGHPDIPVAIERNGVKNPRCFIPYNGIVDLTDAQGKSLYKRSLDVAKIPDGYKLYRHLLSQAADSSILVVAIGFVTTLAQLFESKADEYSDLDGVDLFSKKVKAVYIQSGRFESGDSLSGYNMRAASRQSSVFYDKFPRNVGLYMSPSNVGDMMNYQPQDVLVDLSNTELNPIKSVYTNYTCETGQRMWDTNCLVQAVVGDAVYHLSPRGWVTFVDKGEESLMLFKKDPKGNARYQLPGDTYFAAEKLMDIRRYNRMTKHPAQNTIESPQPQITGAAAADWVKTRMTQLVDKYLGTAGNTLNPDDVRMLFRPLGYTGPNALDYQEAERLLVDAIYDKMIERALRQGRKELVIVTGPPGCGKSYTLKHLNLKKAGLIYDSVLDGPGRLQQVIAKAKQAGMEQITLIPVYNDILTCFQNTVSRGKNTWRFTAIDYMISSFRAGKGKLEEISRTFPDIEILPVDCSHNQGSVRIGLDEALKWDYDVEDEEMHDVLSYLLEIVEGGEVDAGSMLALVGNIREIPHLSPANAALANTIHQKAEEIIKEYKIR